MAAAAAAGKPAIKVGDWVQPTRYDWTKPCKVISLLPRGQLTIETSIGGSATWDTTSLRVVPNPACTKRKQQDDRLKTGDRVRLASLEAGDRVRVASLDGAGGAVAIGSVGVIHYMGMDYDDCDVRWDSIPTTTCICRVASLEREPAKRAKVDDVTVFKAGDRVRVKGGTVAGTIVHVSTSSEYGDVEWDDGHDDDDDLEGCRLDALELVALVANSSSAAASSSSAAALDEAPAASADGIKWISIEPAHLATHELYHEHLKCGVKVSELDLVRAKSKVIQTLLVDCKDSNKRILVPNEAFQTAERMHAFFQFTFAEAGTKIVVPVPIMREYIHAANALDLLHLSMWKNGIESLFRSAKELPYEDQLALGALYYKPELIASGSHAFAEAWRKMTKEERKAVPDHVRLRCATHIMESHGTHCACSCSTHPTVEEVD